LTKRKFIRTFAARKRGNESVGKGIESGFKILKNKVCKFRKGSYLCHPKTREKKSETVLEKELKN
jgi:hypothetical protein